MLSTFPLRPWLRAHPWRAGLAALLSLLLLLDRVFPPPVSLSFSREEPGLIVVAEDGTPLRGWPDGDGVWRYPVRIDEVSPEYLEALVTYEDRWFYWHFGVNPVSLARAAAQWVRYGKIVSGGSTLTMQVARIIDPHSRTVTGKLKQIARAVQLELRYSKREILGYYLNHAPMGGIVEGVEMASRAYLGKPSAQLSAAEAALLVVLPQAPSRLRPDRTAERAQEARDKVLARMAESGLWSQETVDDARIERVGVFPIRGHWLAPLAAERLRREERKKSGKRGDSSSGPAVIRSTLDPELQTMIERLLADRVASLPPRVSIAAIVMETDTLAVRAYAGSADFSDPARFNHVDMARGVRSPGSALKPFLYAMALDDGLIHSESLLTDAPQAFGGYEPGNFQAEFSGPVSAATALQRSLNVPAVDLLDRVGPARFAGRLQNGGLTLRLPAGTSPNLSLILGGAGTTLEELVGAYRALAAGGLAGKPRLKPEAPLVESRLMSAGAAFIVRDILETGGHPDRPFNEASGPRLAWKTGTSFGFRDAWAVGVSDAYTLGVWVGRPDGTPNPGFFGANVAAPLLHEIVYALPRRTGGIQTPSAPESVRAVTICWPLGLAEAQTEAEHCHLKYRAWSLDNAVPPTLPDRAGGRGLLETIWIDPGDELRTTPACNAKATPRRIARWPALLEPWLSAPERQRYGLPPWSPNCPHAAENTAGMRIAGLSPGAQLRPAPGRQTIPLTLSATGVTGKVWWLLDGKLNGATSANAPHHLSLDRNGPRTLTAMDESGRYASLSFSVRGIGE
ncbi:MAG: penicillin-binding protein 1C [Betaproteobacteria bacterium]|nr:penicillin-binding protein 1C [Betaproteobacteria bacterium]